MTRSLFAAATLLALLAPPGCAPKETNQPKTATPPRLKGSREGAPAPENTKVLSFSVDPENLLVDRIAMRDGGIRPDGNRDLVFRATIEGPADALYLITVSEKGEPLYGFRADTIVGHEELPAALGSVVDIGLLTVWIAVVENERFINAEGGTLGELSPGTHQLRLYVPNTGNLAPGAHLRLYARGLNGGLAPGPIIRY